MELVRSIRARYGLAGFYKGSVANCVRVAVKSLYRYPLVLMFQGIYDRLFPGMEHNSRSLTIVKLLSGISIATAESVIVCPLERMKVFFMTRTVFSGGYLQFFQLNSHVLRRELFRGLWIHMIRQNVSWVVWLETDALSKMYIRRKYNIDPFSQSISFRLILPLALFTSVINVLAGIFPTFTARVVMPFDMIKTNLQKEEPESVKEMMARYGKKGGIRCFFVGWRVRLVQYCIQNVFTMNMLEGMEARYRRLKVKLARNKP